MPDTMLNAALQYAKLGIRVFPCWHISGGRCGCGDSKCASPGKHPLTPHGVKQASIEPETVRSWFAGNGGPTPNIGGAMGNGLVAIDEDAPGALLALGIEIPNGPAQRTGRGMHLLFRTNGAAIGNRVKFAPGLDTRSDGGYIMLAPSTHELGKPYRWVDGHGLADLEIPDIPDALTKLACQGGTGNGKADGVDLFGRTVIEELFAKLEAGTGDWRGPMLRIIGSMLARRTPVDVILAACRRATWTQAGYTHADTDAWVTKCIQDTRQRWDTPDPDDGEDTFDQVDGKHQEPPDPTSLCLSPAAWSVRVIPPVEPVVGHLLTRESRVLLSADTGAGKTMLALALAFAGWRGGGFLHWRPGVRSRVLFIDGEMPAGAIKRRLSLAARWFNLPEPPTDTLHVLSTADVSMPPLDTPDGQRWLDAFIDQIDGVDLVAFDNLQALTSQSLKEGDSWLAMKHWAHGLSARRIGQLWMHHTGIDASRAYGDKAREWGMDTVIIGERAELDGAGVAMTLRFQKARNRDPDDPDCRAQFDDVEVRLNDGAWTYRPAKSGSGQPLGRNQKHVLDAATKLLAAPDLKKAPAGHPAGHASVVTVDQVKDEARKLMACDPKHLSSRFSDAFNALTASGRLNHYDGLVWL